MKEVMKCSVILRNKMVEDRDGLFFEDLEVGEDGFIKVCDDTLRFSQALLEFRML